MDGRVICFGATGFTGRLTAEVMVRAGMAPVLAGRSADALVALTGDLAGLGPIDRPPTWQVADAADPASVRALITSPDDVLVSTVGPFQTLGRAAVDAAVDAGCGYVDSTGEPSFIREVFEADGPRAEKSGARLLTAFAYDYVPGNLAAALALTKAEGRSPVAVEVGYFVRGAMSMSSGTRASIAGMAGQKPFARRGGSIVTTKGSVLEFDIDGHTWQAMPVGGSEHFGLHTSFPGVRDVSVGIGWAGRWTKPAHVVTSALQSAASVPGLGSLVQAGARKAATDRTGEGPDATQRARARTLVAARTLDGVGRETSRIVLDGPSPYDLTAELLAWGAAMLLARRAPKAGALGPVDAFGLDALVDGCARMGMTWQ